MLSNRKHGLFYTDILIPLEPGNQVRLYALHNLRARKKRRKTSFVQANSYKDHVSHYHELASRVWPVNTQTVNWSMEISRIDHDFEN